MNYNQNEIAEELKKVFSCKIVTTVHYFEWCLALSGNIKHVKCLLERKKNVIINDNEKLLIEEFNKEKTHFNNVDHIICLSENAFKILTTLYKVNQKKITIINNGLADNMCIQNKVNLRLKYMIPDIPIILFVGRIEKIKGLLYALRAFKIVLNKFPLCHFIIAGDGDFIKLLKECEDIWMKVSLTGLIEKDKLNDLYSIANIGVMPSFHEQCSYVAIEMMMHGIPLIASTSTGLCEMVVNNVTGLQVPVIEYTEKAEIDCSLLAKKLLYLLQHPAKTKKMGINSRIRYLKMYSSEIFRINMLKFYQSLYQ